MQCRSLYMRISYTVFAVYSRVAESCRLVQKFLPITAFGRLVCQQRRRAAVTRSLLVSPFSSWKTNFNVGNDTSSVFSDWTEKLQSAAGEDLFVVQQVARDFCDSEPCSRCDVELNCCVWSVAQGEWICSCLKVSLYFSHAKWTRPITVIFQYGCRVCVPVQQHSWHLSWYRNNSFRLRRILCLQLLLFFFLSSSIHFSSAQTPKRDSKLLPVVFYTWFVIHIQEAECCSNWTVIVLAEAFVMFLKHLNVMKNNNLKDAIRAATNSFCNGFICRLTD